MRLSLKSEIILSRACCIDKPIETKIWSIFLMWENQASLILFEMLYREYRPCSTDLSSSIHSYLPIEYPNHKDSVSHCSLGVPLYSLRFPLVEGLLHSTVVLPCRMDERKQKKNSWFWKQSKNHSFFFILFYLTSLTFISTKSAVKNTFF